MILFWVKDNLNVPDGLAYILDKGRTGGRKVRGISIFDNIFCGKFSSFIRYYHQTNIFFHLTISDYLRKEFSNGW